MKDYKEIAASAEKELNSLRSEKAVLEAKIKEQAEALGLDLNKDLRLQVEEELKSLQNKFDAAEKELDTILKELESVSTSVDESGDFE